MSKCEISFTEITFKLLFSASLLKRLIPQLKGYKLNRLYCGNPRKWLITDLITPPWHTMHMLSCFLNLIEFKKLNVLIPRTYLFED